MTQTPDHRPSRARASAPFGPAREWVTFADPVETQRQWRVDVTFLSSSWECIYGCGCQGTLTEPSPEFEQGCCSYGAHFADRADRDHVVDLAGKLNDEDWQFARQGRKRGIFATIGKEAWRTRLVDDACIFLNRPGFPNGPGCALHRYAMRTGLHHSETKPEVCWQLPLRRVDEEQGDGTVISTLTEFGRDGWGSGGDDFAWWCTEAPDAFVGARPVYQSLESELRSMIGDALYEQLARYLDDRRMSSAPPIFHPAEVAVRVRTSRNTTTPR